MEAQKGSEALEGQVQVGGALHRKQRHQVVNQFDHTRMDFLGGRSEILHKR